MKTIFGYDHNGCGVTHIYAYYLQIWAHNYICKRLIFHLHQFIFSNLQILLLLLLVNANLLMKPIKIKVFH